MAEIARPRVGGPGLPGPVATEWNWQVDGLCRSLSPDVFFHPEGERGLARRRRADRAKSVCDSCPVVSRCRQHALAVREPYGIWGGLTEEERARVYAGELAIPA